MKQSTLPYWITLIVVLGAAYGFFTLYRASGEPSAPRPSASSVGITPKEAQGETQLTNFTLTERSGETFDSASMRGKVWVANFFYASCPSVCVRLSQQLAVLQQEPQFEDIQFVSITTDPSNDTLEVLNSYAEKFDADPEQWLFCRGEADYIKKIGEEILLVAADGPQHSERAVVIDHEGKVRGRFLMTDIAAPNQIAQLRLTVAACQKEAAAAAAEPTADATTESDAQPDAAASPETTPNQDSAADAAQQTEGASTP